MKEVACACHKREKHLKDSAKQIIKSKTKSQLIQSHSQRSSGKTNENEQQLIDIVEEWKRTSEVVMEDNKKQPNVDGADENQAKGDQPHNLKEHN